MRPAHVVASVRLLRWFLRLVVRKNKNVSNPQPLCEPARWTQAPMFLQGIISFRPVVYFHSTKNHNEQYHSGSWSKILRLPVDLHPWRVHVRFHMFFGDQPHFSSLNVSGLSQAVAVHIQSCHSSYTARTWFDS